MIVCHRIYREVVLHPFLAGGSEPQPHRLVIHHRRYRVAQFVDVLWRHQETRLAMLNRFAQATCVKGNNRHARRGRLQRRDSQSFGKRRMHEEIKTSDEFVEIVAKPRELHNIAKTQRRRLRPQLVVQIAIAKHDQPKRWVAVDEIRDRLQQVAMTLAGYQLSRRRDGEYAIINTKLVFQYGAVRLIRESLRVNGTVNDSDAVALDVAVPQKGGYRIRYCNDLGKRLVAKCRHEAHFEAIDTTGYDGRNIRKRSREPAEDIRATAAMAMNDVRAILFQKLRQPIGERQVEVARAKEILNTNSRLPCAAINSRIGRTNERVVMASLS